MIKAIGWLIKISLFSVFILILGNWVQWKGRTVSDQVKTQLSHAERSSIAGSIRRWTGEVTQDARKGARRARIHNETSLNEASSEEPSPSEKIPSSERQKLRALIQELNTTASADRHDNR